MVVHGSKIWPAEEWEYGTPSSAGIDPELLWNASKHLQRDFHVYSFLVVQHGRIAFEQYYRGTRETDKRDILSVNKSILSALAGIALAKGYLSNTDQQIIELFPEFLSKDCDPRILCLNIKHLLTMTSGFYYPRLAADSQPMVDRMRRSDNWLRYILELPVKNRAMNRFQYNNFDAWLLSAVLQRVSQMSIYELANKWLFGPIGIHADAWECEDPQQHLAGSLHLTAKDMARFGYLYLNEGDWNGVQVIPSTWVTESTAGSGPYSYLWWLHPHGYYASGAGGTSIIILPQADMVIVFQAKHLKRFRHPMEAMHTHLFPYIGLS